MKKSIVAIISFLILVSVPLLAVVPVAQAATCNGVETSIDFQCNKYSSDGISLVLMYVINFMAIGVGIAVVIGIIFGGIMYAQSDGEASKAKEGQGIIANSIIGLFLFIFLYGAANFLIPGGAFNLNAKPADVPKSSPAPPGSTTPEPTVPGPTTPVTLAKVYNFRDASSSGVIKSGVLFRSANLDAATKDKKPPDDFNAITKLLSGGLIIDLRRPADGPADPKFPGVTDKQIPLSGSYADFVNDKSTRDGFGSAIKKIAYASGPVLVHCKYGKDRTGWTIAMIMYALGASDSQVVDEYKNSNDNPVPKSKPVAESTLTNAVNAAKAKYGSMDKYLTKGLGLSTADIAALKNKLGA